MGRDGRFGSIVGKIDPLMGQILGFFRSDFSAFGASLLAQGCQIRHNVSQIGTKWGEIF